MRKKFTIERFALFGGLIAVLIEWLALIFFYVHAPKNSNQLLPLSYFATFPETKFAFMTFYILAPISFYIFIKWYLSKHLATPTKVFALSMIGFAALAIIPYDPENDLSQLLHNAIAYFFVGTFLLGIYFVYKKNSDKSLRNTSLIIITLSTIFSLLIYIFKKSPLALTMEIGAGLLCQYWVLWISYKTYIKSRRK